jgi:hypothetical protein
MTLSLIQALESMGLNGGSLTAWEDRLSELADYRVNLGTAMFYKMRRKHQLASGSESKDPIIGSPKGRT